MQNTRLVNLLATLTKKELRDFLKFLHSPLFNTREDMIQLFELIKRELNSKKPKLEKELVYKKLHPKDKFDGVKLNLLRSYLLKLLEQFLSLNETIEDETHHNYYLTQAFRKKNLNKDVARTIRLGYEFLEKQKHRGVDFYEEQLKLDWETYFSKADLIYREKIGWSHLSEQTDIIYFLKKLHIAVLAKAAKQVLNDQSKELLFLKEIFEKSVEKPFSEVEAIRIYIACFKMLDNPNEEQFFFEFKKLLFANTEKFPSTEIRDLYILAVNFCIKQVNKGTWETRFFEEILSLYKNGLENEVLLQDGQLSRFTYHNIVAAALKIEDFKWLEWFIEVYKNFLAKPFRESTYSFSMARLDFARKNYDGALIRLQSSNYRDILLNLASRTIRLKIYFETDEWDVLASHLEATKVYLRRKKVMGYHRKFYENLIKYTQKLMAINFYDKATVASLSDKIKAEEFLTEKDWLLSQL